MKMNILKNIAKAFFVTLLVIMIAPGCKKSASLDGDPLVRDTLFTFTPSHGYPGSTVLIKGSGLNDVTAISFGVKAGTIVSKSDAEISVTIPVGAVTAKVTMVKPSTVLTSFTNFVIDATPIPTITKFTPAIAGSGDTVTLTGNLLDKADSVFIGTLKATVLAGKTATSMKIICPLGMTTNKINMYYDYMTSYGMKKVAISASDNPLTLALASITSYDANIGALNVGQVLVIKGKMLSEIIPATGVTFVNRVAGYTASDTIKTATFVASGDTMLSVTVPAGATYGVIKLKMLDGTVTSGGYSVILPTITSFLPAKGATQANIRAFSLLGTKLDLVTSVSVGATVATIQTRTANELVFTADGNAAGTISLVAPNGTVKSAIPYIQTGDFWVTDWSTTFPINRFANFANNGLGNFTQNNAGTFGQFTVNGALSTKSMYMWSPTPGGDDRFSLYTPDPNGVYFEFDMRVDALVDSCKQTDGTLKFKIFCMDSKGWGAAGEFSYGSNSPTSKVKADGQWYHFKLHLKDFKASDNQGLYSADQPATANLKPGAFCHPNSIRIMAFVFGTPNVSGNGSLSFSLDNIKFSIQ